MSSITSAETADRAAPGPLASFVRFVVCGGGAGILAGAAVALLAGSMPWGVANAVVTVVSTALCTELHALFTFGTGRRAGWRRHRQSAGSAAVAYAVTSLAVFVLHLLHPSPGAPTEQVVYLSASALAGIGRFLVLRLFVFTGDDGRTGIDGDHGCAGRDGDHGCAGRDEVTSRPLAAPAVIPVAVTRASPARVPRSRLVLAAGV
ncbi:GtrA family protein [Streptomyces beigongshangae]|uniref:GtrA family protein n=1 Tax=Streptomyces beigongshangae TaxID=2841597 RepID=UPI0027E01F4A|nr:GtrA family protein [Streptomyces sp. REN17]